MNPDKNSNALSFKSNLSELGRAKYERILSYFDLTSENEKQQINFQRDSILDKELKRIVEDSYKYGDKGFLSFIPESYIQGVGDTPDQIYLRFSKISTILLVEHLCFFNAFGIKPSSDAKKRSVLFSYIKRVYDDLVDTGNNPDEVYRVICNGKTQRNDPEFKLLAHLGKLIKAYAPPNEFKNFYCLWLKAHRTQSKKPENPTLQHLREIAYGKVRYSFLVDSYVMINDLSSVILNQRKISAELFQCTDDLNDMQRDLEAGLFNYLNRSSDPEKIIREKYSEVAASMNKIAPQPRLYLYLMEYFMERAISHSIKK